jgi:hypothetical protein
MLSGWIGNPSVQLITVFPCPCCQLWDGGTFSTKIPYDIQKFWFNNVVIPALKEIGDGNYLEYTDYNVDERVKKLAHKAGQCQDGHAVQAKDWLRLQQSMRRIVDNDPQMDHFQSFFFVIDCKGCKSQTTCTDPNDLPLEKLKVVHPLLNWDFMADPVNGELAVDVGVSFHVKPERKVVGLWVKDKLAQSYGQAGFKTPTVHYAASLHEVGRMQAEMRCDQVHGVQIHF